MKEFVAQNIITLLCFVCIVITLIFAMKNSKQLKYIVNNDNSLKKNENKAKVNTGAKTYYCLFTGVILLSFLLLFVVPYACKKANEIKLQQLQLQRLEKIDAYLLEIDEELFMGEKNSEELLSLHKELVSEREFLTKKSVKGE